MKKTRYIYIFLVPLLVACSGSRKYFKAAERLEKQGLLSEAAEYYLESLQRKPGNVKARIKLKEVGQKHISNMASEFFRNYNTQQLDGSLESYERLKAFNEKTSSLSVKLDYPKTYDEDYQKAVEMYCSKNNEKAHVLVNQKNYGEALTYISKVEKYNPSYKNTRQLSIIAICEPLYQGAINFLENKNYNRALINLENIKAKSENYKDTHDLFELATSQQNKSFILFKPSSTLINTNKSAEEYLYNGFSHSALQRQGLLKIINNTLFQNTAGTANDLHDAVNADLIQAIRKATGADYFYLFEVSNVLEYNSATSKTPARGFQEVKTRKNDTLVITEYKSFDYIIVKAQRSFSYDFKYRVINAYTNQVIASQVQALRSQDAVEYQEFKKAFNGNIQSLFPYNPQQTPSANQYNPRSWRSLFSTRNNLKLMEELKSDVYNKNINLFVNSMSNMK